MIHKELIADFRHKQRDLHTPLRSGSQCQEQRLARHDVGICNGYSLSGGVEQVHEEHQIIVVLESRSAGENLAQDITCCMGDDACLRGGCGIQELVSL